MADVAWLLRRARIDDDTPLVDLALDGGVIRACAPELPLTGAQEWDLKGTVVLPGLVDPHVHLDRSYLPAPHHDGSLRGAQQAWASQQPFLSYESYLARAEQALRQALLSGTIALRSHVDLSVGSGSLALEALLELREKCVDVCELQIVALGRPGGGERHERALIGALEAGAEVVGGHLDLADEPLTAVRAALDLAERYGRPLDLHLGEEEVEGSVATLLFLAEQVVLRGLQGRVTVAPCASLEGASDRDADRVIEALREAAMNVVALPGSGALRFGRGRHPAPRGVTRVWELLGRGVNVAVGSDDVHGAFDPFGRYDPLLNVHLLARAAQLSGPREREALPGFATHRAAEVMGLVGYGLYEGGRADLVVVRARRVADVVADVPERLALFRRGRLLYRSRTQRSWAEGLPGWLR